MGSWEISTDGGSTYTDLADLYLDVKSAMGTGMLVIKNLSSPLALLPGEEYHDTTVLKRPFALRGDFNLTGSNKAAYHSRKQALLKMLNANAGELVNQRPQTILLKYTGAAVDKIVYCYYEGGLEDEALENEGFAQKNIALRFVAFDPYFYGTSESNVSLDSIDSSTFTLVAAKIDGLWDDLGPPAGSGTYNFCYAIASDETYVYFAGSFANFDGIAAADNIVRLNKSTGAFSALGSGLNQQANGCAVGADGTLYAGGTFTNAGGDADADYLAQWNGSSWSAVGTPASGATITYIKPIRTSPDGKIYVGGSFSNLAGIAAADNIAYWDGSGWNAVGSGASGNVYDIAIRSADKVYAVGSFGSAGGAGSTAGIALWDGSSWNSVGGGMDTGTAIWAVAISPGGDVYVGGDFSSMGGVSASNIAKWNGSRWSALGSGVNDVVRSLAFDSNGDLVVGGDFTTAGGVPIGAGMAVWNGSGWVRQDVTINVGGSPAVWSLHYDSEGDLYIGFDTSGTARYAGSTTIAYEGSAMGYPYVTINRSGGTDAKIIRLTNVTTKAEIYLNYDLVDGETLTIDARPFSDTPLTAVSSFFGSVPGAILGGSNSGDFFLTPGRSGGSNDNVIACFVNPTGSPTITVTAYYTPAYLSQD